MSKFDTIDASHHLFFDSRCQILNFWNQNVFLTAEFRLQTSKLTPCVKYLIQDIKYFTASKFDRCKNLMPHVKFWHHRCVHPVCCALKVILLGLLFLHSRKWCLNNVCKGRSLFLALKTRFRCQPISVKTNYQWHKNCDAHCHLSQINIFFLGGYEKICTCTEKWV